MTEIISSQLSQYIDGLIPERPPELQAMEAWAKEHDFPIIGPACGYLCYQVARMIGATKIFELGSGYGYSTAFFARALKENGGGVVHHVVWDDQLSNRARKHLAALGFHDEVRYHNGEAVQTLRDSTDGPYDLIFNDIDKQGYPAALPVIEERLRPGGVLIIDNMVWHNRIFDQSDQTPDTQGVRAVTTALTTSPKWIASLVPIRDGMIVAVKR
jgi:predicted O-methyltransferase YrrM